MEKPRIAIDDGEAVLRAKLTGDDALHLKSVAYSRVVDNVAVLLHPTAIAVDRDNNYIIADEGGEVEDQWKASLWKISSTGEIPYKSGDPLPVPQPIYSGDEIENPTAVVVDEQNLYYLLSVGEITSSSSVRSAIYSFSAATGNITPVINQTTTPTLPTINPVDMVLATASETSKQFIVLDRGSHRVNSKTKLVVISTNPLKVEEEHPLATVVEPTALIREADTGQLIIADAKEPPNNDSPFNAADLLRVDPNNNWSVTSLLGNLTLEENPLIFPTGLAWESTQILLVCDTGVRNKIVDDNSNRHRAEPAAIYRVDLSQTPPKISNINNQRKLVHPTKIVVDRQGDLLVTDRGSAYNTQGEKREWRVRPNEFGVVVLFSQQRPTSRSQRNKIRFDIANVIDEQKVCPTFWWMRSLSI